MSKKPKPVDRRMISVPPELNARMATHDDVNWSSVACRAFEQKLGEIAAQKKVKNMNDVIARLRASKQDEESEMYAAGKRLGEDWARNRASAAELRRLARLADRFGNAEDWDGFFTVEPGHRDAFSTADRLAFIILGNEDDHDRHDSTNFWASATGLDQYKSDLADLDFLEGFGEGAYEIWEAVEAQL